MKKQHECFGISPLRGRFGYRGRFRSGKSPLIAPIGRRNSGEMGWSRGDMEQNTAIGGGGFQGSGFGMLQGVMGVRR